MKKNILVKGSMILLIVTALYLGIRDTQADQIPETSAEPIISKAKEEKNNKEETKKENKDQDDNQVQLSVSQKIEEEKEETDKEKESEREIETVKNNQDKKDIQPIEETKIEYPVDNGLAQRITSKVITRTRPINFATKRKHQIEGAETRVSQAGKDGSITEKVKITYTDGVESSLEVIDTKRIEPVDQIIETYVMLSDKQVETREVDDLDRPIYREVGRERWFFKDELTGTVDYFYSADEAYQKYLDGFGSWGTADSEMVTTDEIIGYEKKLEEVVVKDQVWAWE